MRIFIIMILFSSYAHANLLSYGTGVENCNWSTTQTLNQRVFNCADVTIGVGAIISFNASDYIVIMSRGDVTIDGDINLNASGSTAGAGGSNGGVCPAFPGVCNGVNGGAKNGGQGVGGSAGVTGASGGGGSGASFGSTTATNGSPGANGTGGGTIGAGGVASNTTYFPETGFTSNFTGGAGGGAGGSGTDTGVPTTEPGGAGGGGGGGLIIVAMGTVTINGNINANGANGSPGSSANFGQAGGGGGGGGSGGAVYIIGTTAVNIVGANVITAIGGNGGAGGSGGAVLDVGGAGGNASVGRIRVDSPSGAYAGGGTTNPVAYQSVLPYIYDPLADGQTFESDIEAACSYREINNFNYFYSMLIGFFMAMLLVLGISKGLRHLQYSDY